MDLLSFFQKFLDSFSVSKMYGKRKRGRKPKPAVPNRLAAASSRIKDKDLSTFSPLVGKRRTREFTVDFQSKDLESEDIGPADSKAADLSARSPAKELTSLLGLPRTDNVTSSNDQKLLKLITDTNPLNKTKVMVETSTSSEPLNKGIKLGDEAMKIVSGENDQIETAGNMTLDVSTNVIRGVGGQPSNSSGNHLGEIGNLAVNASNDPLDHKNDYDYGELDENDLEDEEIFVNAPFTSNETQIFNLREKLIECNLDLKNVCEVCPLPNQRNLLENSDLWVHILAQPMVLMIATLCMFLVIIALFIGFFFLVSKFLEMIQQKCCPRKPRQTGE